MLYAADAAWWRHHADEALKFPGLKVTCDDSTPFPAVKCLKVSGKHGFDPDPACVRTGNNSGYQALHIAVQAGAARVLLFGFDMHGTHWHGRHPEPLANTSRKTFETWLERFGELAVELKDRVDVVNCSPDSRLSCFRKASLESMSDLCGVPQ